GRITFFEWVSAGHYTSQNERGTMALVTQGPIKDLYFGFNVQALLIRVDFDRPARTALADFDLLRVSFLEPHGFELRITPAKGTEPAQGELRREGLVIPAPDVEVGIDLIAEIAIPFERLGVKVDQ